LDEREKMEREIFKVDFPTEIVQEGAVKVLVPKLKAFVTSPSEYAPSKAPVFYNPVMELNRDLAVLALQAYQRMLDRKVSICEPLAGCGVRGTRFATEVEGVKQVVINDINAKAIQLANCNVQMNKLSERALVKNDDANLLLSSYSAPRKRFDVIDIDPFGSPVPYLDSAIRALRNGGLLALTATDMAPLCGVHSKACLRKYGGKPLRTEYCHELAVRLLAGSLATTATKHEIGVKMLFSHSTDHYIRIYATARCGAKKADENVRNMGYILHCFKCLHREAVKELVIVKRSLECDECTSNIDVAGPLWLGKLVDKHFCGLMEDEARQRKLRHGGKIRKILTLVKNEADAPPTYYVVDKLCGKLGLPVPPVKRVVNALEEAGFEAFLTHFSSSGIKSDASSKDVKEIIIKTQDMVSFK
jgi:tRNA (guanine26-N2/guanine27-N2)-dimethyltransferase